MSTIRLSSEPGAAVKDVTALEDSVNEFNMVVTGDRGWKPVCVFLRDEEGRLRGGITADLWGGWMHIRFLWVDADLRKQGYGAKLMQAAENEARVHGCQNAHVETFSFQARPFYERLGYRVIAELPDYPPGHSHYILRKALF
jgi:GNAT superfamily N-acetyltransferase